MQIVWEDPRLIGGVFNHNCAFHGQKKCHRPPLPTAASAGRDPQIQTNHPPTYPPEIFVLRKKRAMCDLRAPCRHLGGPNAFQTGPFPDANLSQACCSLPHRISGDTCGTLSLTCATAAVPGRTPCPNKPPDPLQQLGRLHIWCAGFFRETVHTHHLRVRPGFLHGSSGSVDTSLNKKTGDQMVSRLSFTVS